MPRVYFPVRFFFFIPSAVLSANFTVSGSVSSGTTVSSTVPSALKFQADANPIDRTWSNSSTGFEVEVIFHVPTILPVLFDPQPPNNRASRPIDKVPARRSPVERTSLVR